MQYDPLGINADWALRDEIYAQLPPELQPRMLSSRPSTPYNRVYRNTVTGKFYTQVEEVREAAAC